MSRTSKAVDSCQRNMKIQSVHSHFTVFSVDKSCLILQASWASVLHKHIFSGGADSSLFLSNRLWKSRSIHKWNDDYSSNFQWNFLPFSKYISVCVDELYFTCNTQVGVYYINIKESLNDNLMPSLIPFNQFGFFPVFWWKIRKDVLGSSTANFVQYRVRIKI